MKLTVLMMLIFNIGIYASEDSVISAQQKSVTGKVTDESGENIAGCYGTAERNNKRYCY